MGLANFFESKILALNVIILGLDALILGVASFLPFWFKLHISPEDATYGTEGRRENYVIKSGLFFMSTDEYVDMIFMGKVNNPMFAPRSITVGQLMYLMGTLGIVACMMAGVILACRRLGSVVGEFFWAGFVSASSVCVIVGVVAPVFLLLGLDDNHWINVPMNNPRRLAASVWPTDISLDWAFYVAVIGAVMSIVAALLSWMEAIKTCRYIEDIRAKQIRDPSYGQKEDVPYTRFQSGQQYALTVPQGQPSPQQLYGEPRPGPQISRQIEI